LIYIGHIFHLFNAGKQLLAQQ